MSSSSIAGLNLPNASSNHKDSRLLKAALNSKCQRIPRESFFWNESFFGLDKVSIFQKSSKIERQEILKLCSQSLLAETYLVEKAGVGYMAKMALMAESMEERMLYALFAADEAHHLAEIDAIIPNLKLARNSFSSFLSDFLELEDKETLLFVVQVILEGWGLTHYRILAKHCLDANLTQMYAGFLQAEARHHAMGLIYFQTNYISDSSPIIEQAVSSFLSLVQAGPVSVVEAIQAVKGNLSQAELVQIFTELETENQSNSRLQLLHHLMCQSGAIAIVNRLEGMGCFQPFSASDCAKLLWR